MAKAIVSNWITSAIGVMILAGQLYTHHKTGVAMDVDVTLAALGFMVAKDGGK